LRADTLLRAAGQQDGTGEERRGDGAAASDHPQLTVN
jgi:hypothetical protein